MYSLSSSKVICMIRLNLVLAPVLMAAIVPAARADTATLSITGRVLPGTCVLSALPVKLPDVKANDLADLDNHLQATTLSLTSCVGVTSAALAFDGEQDDSDARLWKNTATAGAARGVSFSILEGASGTTYIKKGTTLSVSVSGANASQPIRVGYHKQPRQSVSAGVMSADITITASYQ